MRYVLFFTIAILLTSQNTYAQSDSNNPVRIPPIAAPNMEVSGFCCMKFDVSKKGKPKKVKAYSCTHDVLKNSAEKSVKKWRYNPFYVNGKKQARQGVTSKVSYHLRDIDGSVLYDPEIYIPRGVDWEKPKGWSAISCNQG